VHSIGPRRAAPPNGHAMTGMLSPDLLLRAYAMGVFPMAATRDDPHIHWVDPRLRGVLPLDRFHLSRSLARRLRSGEFHATVDTDFAGVVDGCADREETWINPAIRAAYGALHDAGLAHSLEVRDADGALVGGVYGVTIGQAFFGESMFSRRTDASKAALAWLVDRLRIGGYTLFDTQFLTPHLASLGAVEVPRATYHRKLAQALEGRAEFHRAGEPPDGQSLVQRSSHTS